MVTRSPASGNSSSFLILAIAAAIFLLIGYGTWVALSRSRARPVLVASLNDAGGRIALTGTGALAGLSDLDPGEETLMRTALTTGRIPAGPAPLPANAPPGVTAAFRVFAPAGIRVLPTRPAFRWSAVQGAAWYLVTIFDLDEKEVARSEKLTITTWKPAATLPRGKPLLWRVTAGAAGNQVTAPPPPEPAAQFEIIPADAARRIDEVRGFTPPSHLLLALLYAREGLRGEAATELATLSALNQNSPLVDSLRRSLDSAP